MLKIPDRQKLICACLFIYSFVLIIPAQTGGNFTITQPVIASGGGQNSAGGNFTIDHTIGQSLAGAVSVGGADNRYAVRGGFWAADSLAPTAANSSISGRITDLNNNGIALVTITVLDTSTGITRSTTSNSFGFYKIDELATTHLYIVTARSRRFTFAPESHFINLFDEQNETHFTAVEGN